MVRFFSKSPCSTVPHGHLSSADLQRVGVIPIDVGSRAEKGVNLLSKEIIEGVDGHHAHRVGKDHLSGVKVQLHPDPGQLPLQVQRGAGPRHGRVLTLVVCNHPKATFGTT